MRVFVLRSRRGPTAADYVDRSFGPPNHFEIVAHSIANSLFISNNIRQDVIFHVVLEGPPEPPKTISFDTRNLSYLGGFDERTLAAAVKRALDASSCLAKDESREVDSGLRVSRMSFEHLVRELTENRQVYLLSKKGTDIRKSELPQDGGFLFTDHFPMQKKTFHLLKRLGVQKISLGPVMLYAAHCIVLVHNELDRREREIAGG